MSRAGFTLIELLVVIAIVSILAVILLPNLVNSQKRAYDVRAQSCGNMLSKAAYIYRVDHPKNDDYPAPSFYYGTAEKDSEYGTALCREMDITGDASTGDFRYTVAHPSGKHTYEVTLSGVKQQ